MTAWNERDADRYASLFAPDGTTIGFDGSQANGSEIAQHLRPIFADRPTAADGAKVRTVRPLGTSGAILHAIAGMVPPGRTELNPAVNAVQSLVAERYDDGWRIVMFQNTPAQYHGRPELVEEHTAELRPLVASGTTVG